jgi:gliding motility-associated-like protein
VKIKADTLGTESLCMYICDQYKRCDTTYIVINVIPKTPKNNIDTVYREILLNKSDTVCIKSSNLGVIDSVYNYCAGASGTAVKFSFSQNSACIKYEGLKVGLEKGCFVVCDKVVGKCDTTIVFIKVKKDSTVDTTTTKKLPIAVKDSESTILETSVVIDVLKNDSIRGTFKQMKVFIQPKYGDAYYTQSNQGNPEITYIPKANTCNVIDTFSYFLENEYGRDSTIVCVAITCQKLVIFNGFSPNRDNINEVFTILGIEEHPDNIVTIYNRWGNRIFYAEGYTNQNGWDGTWEGKELQDGTYFYQVKLPRLGKLYTGYVELKR